MGGSVNKLWQRVFMGYRKSLHVRIHFYHVKDLPFVRV